MEQTVPQYVCGLIAGTGLWEWWQTGDKKDWKTQDAGCKKAEIPRQDWQD